MAVLCFSVTIPSSYGGATLRQRSSFFVHRRSFLLCLQEKIQYGLPFQKYPDTEAEENLLATLPECSIYNKAYYSPW